jgi:UDP-N-acetylglucosamine transferase subunit ALG13
MILMTLGTIPFQFDRALLWLNQLIEQNVLAEPIFVQYGVSDISILSHHSFITAEPTVVSERLFTLVDQARLVISHAGQGSTRMLAARGASFVLLPRLKCYQEHIDDHQLEFAQAVESFGVQYCLSFEQLQEAVLNPPPCFQEGLFNGPKLSHYLAEAYATRPDSTLLSRQN